MNFLKENSFVKKNIFLKLKTMLTNEEHTVYGYNLSLVALLLNYIQLAGVTFDKYGQSMYYIYGEMLHRKYESLKLVIKTLNNAQNSISVKYIFL